MTDTAVYAAIVVDPQLGDGLIELLDRVLVRIPAIDSEPA
jgi:hypothetical protein